MLAERDEPLRRYYQVRRWAKIRARIVARDVRCENRRRRRLDYEYLSSNEATLRFGSYSERCLIQNASKAPTWPFPKGTALISERELLELLESELEAINSELKAEGQDPARMDFWENDKGMPALVWDCEVSGIEDEKGREHHLGKYFSLALQADGTVVAWGDNSVAQCKVPAGLKDVRMIAAGNFHSLALKVDGSVVAWGRNYAGACNVPAGLGSVVAVAAGSSYSVALKSDGTVVAWGDNYRGGCNVPAGLKDVVAIAAGFDHNLALKADGHVVFWGSDYNGELAAPADLDDVVAITTGQNTSLARKKDGSVVIWGFSSYSLCSLPAGLSGVTAFAAGTSEDLALNGDGTVINWTNNLQSFMPAGLKAHAPGFTRCVFDVTPLAWGPVSVQVPAGVCTTVNGISNADSNILQLTYGPRNAIRSWTLFETN